VQRNRSAAQLGAATVDVITTAIDAASPDNKGSEMHAADAATAPRYSRRIWPSRLDPLAGVDAEHQQIEAELEREIGVDPEQATAMVGAAEIRAAGPAPTPHRSGQPSPAPAVITRDLYQALSATLPRASL
jgi:hypothetical protein